MICTNFDGYMTQLCHHELMISWKITLTDNTIVYGDYDRPGHDNAWERLKIHCQENDVLPKKVELYMFGAEHKVFFENEDGLDGIAVMRGMGKEQTMDGSHSQSYQTLTVLFLHDSCDYIDVGKYTWPINELEQKVSTRQLTTENLEHMIFKNGSEKFKNPKVQKYIHWK